MTIQCGSCLFTRCRIQKEDKSLENPPAQKRSSAYTEFVEPLDKSRRGGFDVHVYWDASIPEESQYATELYSRIRYECTMVPFTNLIREFDPFTVPELRIYKIHHTPIGPHPKAMFEVNILSPEEFGAFIPWLAIYRGPLSALLHPNTTPSSHETELRDHTERACWLGTPVPLIASIFEEAE